MRLQTFRLLASLWAIICLNGAFAHPEVKVVSHSKPTYQSSTFNHGGTLLASHFAVDGNKDQRITVREGVCAHTNHQVNPWWVVALLGEFRIHHVVVWNRGDCCGERLQSMRVEARLWNGEWSTCGTIGNATQNGAVYTVACQEQLASFVRIVLSKPQPEFLQLCEVEVWAEERPRIAKFDLISRGKTSALSSIFNHGGTLLSGHFVNDGNYGQHITVQKGVCGHTNHQVHPWWRLELIQPHRVQLVRIYNRGDCCGERLTSVQVEVGNGEQFQSCGGIPEPTVDFGVYEVACDGIVGTVVRVILAKQQPEYLQLCEVDVFGELLPVDSDNALLISHKKPTFQSSTFNYAGKLLASQFSVDGNKDNVITTQGGVCAHSNLEVHPWWTVALLGEFKIHRVMVWNRGDCCGERLQSMRVDVRLWNGEWASCGAVNHTTSNGAVYTVQCQQQVVSFVRIILDKPQADYLQLCEVEVWGEQAPRAVKFDLISRGKSSTLSSVYNHGGTLLASSFVNDGKYGQDITVKEGVCGHTNHQVQPWWKLDLKQEHKVQLVRIFNRGDCCGERLNSVRVEVGNGSEFKSCGQVADITVNYGVYEVSCNGMVGTSVRVILSKPQPEYLQLCEVDVFGEKL